MSDNLSVDEIIKQAEKIKREAEIQLKNAERVLDEQAKSAMKEVSVDAKKVLKPVIDDDDDVKEYVPTKTPQKSKLKEKINDLQAVKINDIPNSDTEKTNVIKLKKDDSKENSKSIEKTRQVELKTATVPDLKKSKKAFTNSDNAQSDYEKTKPVTFSSEVTVDEKNDLQRMPVIVARDRLNDSPFASQKYQEYEEEVGVQIKFEGFDDEIEDVPTIDEELAEQMLMEQRKEKVGKFRLFGPDETDKELGENTQIKNDYDNESERNNILKSFYAKKDLAHVRSILTVVFGGLLLMLTMFKNSGYFPDVLSSHTAYFATALVLYVIILAINLNVIIHGFNFKGGINFDFPIAITSIAILAHTTALLFYDNLRIDNGVLLASASTFGIFMSQIGKHRLVTRIIDNFEFLTEKGDKYTLENITNAVDAEIISRGLIEGEPLIKTSVKTDFPTNFLEISCKYEPADKISKGLSFAVFITNIALAVFVGIFDNWNTAINVFASGICISNPVVSLFATNMLLNDVSQGLDNYGSRISGFEGAYMADDANAMVMEASDLFGKNSCDILGIKTFNGAKVDEAIIYSAAVMIKTKSPLSHAFDDVIIGKQSILPVVEGVTYEDKMGTSAWIYKRKILVGNRELLMHHGVSVPKESFESRYTRKGRKALYLAVGGKIWAMFVVSYSADPDLKRELKKLEKTDITIIVKSSDPYINEDSLAELFELPAGFIRVMNSASARVYDKYSKLEVEKSPAYVVHDGTALGFVSAMRGAKAIVSFVSLLSFLVTFGCALGFVVIALLSVFKLYDQISAVNIFAFQLIWSGFVLLVTKIKSWSL